MIKPDIIFLAFKNGTSKTALNLRTIFTNDIEEENRLIKLLTVGYLSSRYTDDLKIDMAA